MTPPEPTDRELKKLDDDAMIERSERGDDPFMSDVMAHRRRVLFTAGERHGIERALKELRYRMSGAFGEEVSHIEESMRLLESLLTQPASPASEPVANVCPHCVNGMRQNDGFVCPECRGTGRVPASEPVDRLKERVEELETAICEAGGGAQKQETMSAGSPGSEKSAGVK